ncbi:probable Internalin A [Coccomyxa sp. Obi]|nr:probable Internalin A [Coccomyxa sp. Obi]
MDGFSEAQSAEFMSDPRTSGANAIFYTRKVPPWESNLEEACRSDLHRQDVPKVSPLRGVRLLGCFGSKPSADITDGWDHMPHDILVAIVRCAGPKEARAMHMVCKSWHMAVRSGLTELTPRAKRCCFESIRCFFPRVTDLRLRGFSIGAEDAALVGGLSRLQRLQLDGVAFAGRTVISKLASLQGLRQLDLANVMGSLPAECDSFLKSLTKLTSLRLHNESVAAKMPAMHCLSELVSLQELTLSESLHFLVPGLTNISALADLRQLSLTKVGVTNAVLRGVGGLQKLRSLHMHDAFRVTDVGLSHLSTLTGLTHLDFCCTSNRRDEDITDAGVTTLSALTNLASLNLAGHSELTSDGVAFLAECTNLTSLDLSGLALGLSGGCNFLAPLLQLRSLSLKRTQLSAGQLPVLSSLTHLTSLTLAWCGLDDEAAAALLPLTKMRSLDVRFCPLTNLGFKSVSRAMPHLERVPLEGCPITTVGVWRLFYRYNGIKLWPSEQDRVARFMSVGDALLLASLAPGQRRLRVAVHPERSWPMTALVSAGVASFFLAYFGILVLFFLALFLFPIFMLGCIFVALCLAALGARYMMRSIRSVWCHCDCAFSTFLLGQHAHAHPHGEFGV